MKLASVLLALVLASPAAPAATFTVTSPDDAGPGTLRQAILDANAAPGADVITFAVAAPGIVPILVLSPLPPVTESATIDGATQPGYAGTPRVELDGTAAGAGAVGLDLEAGASTVRALAIVGFSSSGLRLLGGGSAVEGCHVGVDAAGTAVRGNGQAGIRILSGAHRIGGAGAGNVIAGQPIGIEVDAAESGNAILGNTLGTLADGRTAAGSSLGIRIRSPGTVLGGPAPGEGNLVSGHQGDGVLIHTGADGSVVQGNRIGTDGAGLAAVPNTANGVSISDANGILVGGTGPGEGNLISGNGGNAVAILGTGNAVLGNRIGLDAAGNGAIPNAAGVSIGIDGVGNSVGGVSPGEANTIAFNVGPGVGIIVGEGNPVRGNVFFDNGAAIDLLAADAVAGPTPNDPGDPDLGGNRLQNFPVLTAVDAMPGQIRVVGTLSPETDEDYTLDFYAASACTARPRDLPQAQLHLGSAVVSAHGELPTHGDIAFDILLEADLPPGHVVTAAATDASGNTSEIFGGIVFDVAPRSGSPEGGEALVIRGTDFAPDAEVRIAGVPVSSVVADSATIAAVSPALPPGTVAALAVDSETGADGALAFAWVADFLDVPPSHPFHDAVVALVSNGVAAGCGPGFFCPDDPVTRAQAAPLLLRGSRGVCFTPPECSGTFADVPCPSLFADWIEQLADSGVAAGCGAGNFCPDLPLRRDQAAPLILKTRLGASHTPPPCSGIFADVPCPSPFADWIEELVVRGIAAGCGGGNYCPGEAVTRGQAAALIAKAFGLS